MQLVEKAKKIIEQNWRGSFSVPTDALYPFQWMWDSGFVALGTACFDLDSALQEIDSMFTGQWENGMLPHIIFHSETEETYFPNWDFWESSVNAGAPQEPKTSGITQPAVYGFILEYLWQMHPDNPVVIDKIKSWIPKIVDYHRFLYTYRDPNQEGLFFIYHPWESGRDNSPIWDESLQAIQLTPDDIPQYQRRDLSISDADHRPTKEQYDRYVYLLQLGKKYRYEGKEIAQQSPLCIQDCMMNAILIRSNEAIIKMGKRLGIDVTYIERMQEKSKQAFIDRFWSDELSFFVSYDKRRQRQMIHKEIGGIIPLFANVATTDQAQHIVDYLWDLHHKGYALCPSFDVESDLYDSKRYWRGPIWPQMNWMIYHGLKNYGYNELAEIVKGDFVDLVQRHGFYEYFEPEKKIAATINQGYGGDSFSWTASSVIHLLST